MIYHHESKSDFAVVTCGEGAVVVDTTTGHQVTGELSPDEASYEAQTLNFAAGWPNALNRVLGDHIAIV